MTYEQTTITGEIEITDSKTTKVIARKLTLTATRPAFLCCKKYGVGDRVDVFLPATVNPDEGKGTGLWLPGGYSSHWLRHRITKVNDLPSVDNIKESKSVKLMLTATRETSMKWKLYHTGTKVEVTLPAQAVIKRGAGPWEPGGYESCWLNKYAIEVRRPNKEA